MEVPQTFLMYIRLSYFMNQQKVQLNPQITRDVLRKLIYNACDVLKEYTIFLRFVSHTYPNSDLHLKLGIDSIETHFIHVYKMVLLIILEALFWGYEF